MPVDITTKREDPMSTHPTTFADLAAAGWTPGGVGAAGHLFRSIKIGPYEITAYTDGGGVSLERRDGAIQISEADTVALATKIAALLRGEPSADLVKAEARITEAHAALDEAGAPACDGVLSGRITSLAIERNALRDSLRAGRTDAGAVNSRLAADLARTQAERDTLRQQLANTLAANNAVVEALLLAGFREGDTTIVDDIRALVAERDTLRARLADPPTETAAEATIRRLRSYLSKHTGADHTDADIVGAVVRELRSGDETVKSLQDRLDRTEKRAARAEDIAQEQLRHRMRGT